MMRFCVLKNIPAACFFLLSAAFVLGDAVWIDVRSPVEHAIDNIEGDMRVSHSEIVPAVTQHFPDKETEIQLYCRSGGRAGKAMAALQEAGYSKVFNAGSIDDARRQRGLDD